MFSIISRCRIHVAPAPCPLLSIRLLSNFLLRVRLYLRPVDFSTRELSRLFHYLTSAACLGNFHYSRSWGHTEENRPKRHCRAAFASNDFSRLFPNTTDASCITYVFVFAMITFTQSLKNITPRVSTSPFKIVQVVAVDQTDILQKMEEKVTAIFLKHFYDKSFLWFFKYVS